MRVAGTQRLDGTETWHLQLRRYVRERIQDEGALVQAGMGQGEAGLMHHQVII